MTTRSQRKLGRFSYETEIKVTDKKIAEKLIKEFNLNVNYARYHVDGTWYNLLEDYPAVLFDMYGYIIIKSENDLKGHILETKKINIHCGISNLPEYKKFSHIPKSIENYEEQIKIKEQEDKIRKERFLRLQSIMKKSILDAKIN